jgi:hypothetical protein
MLFCLLFIGRLSLRDRTPPRSYLFNGLTVAVLLIYIMSRAGENYTEKIKIILKKDTRPHEPKAQGTQELKDPRI